MKGSDLKIKRLSLLFAKYKIYPKSCYKNNSPVIFFKKKYPDNYFNKDLQLFLSCQNYAPNKRGADLPWWGKNYFSKKKGCRVFIISQDSNAEDAGSIVFFANLFPIFKNKSEYENYLNEGKLHFVFESWERIKKRFIEWGIDFDYIYITDGKKIYKENPRKDGCFDIFKSKELLEAEIDLCNPDLIITLGKSSLELLDGKQIYRFTVGKKIKIKEKLCVASPFLTGQGISQPNFNERLSAARKAIESVIRKK